MATKALATRLERLEAKQRPALVIDAVVIGGAPIAGVVIVIGGIPNHDKQNTGPAS